jgi:SAM-dependent methyltransferase
VSEPKSNDVLREWRESAPYWRQYNSTIRTMFSPVTKALIEEAGIAEGDVVLDVAGGPGEPSLTIAQLVGPNGSVTCTDAVAEMVEAAENEASRRELRNIGFRQCVADLLPFESNHFDVVVCRFGVMFFPDPLLGLREMLRVTKSGGVVALAVWGKVESNPFGYIVTNVLSRYLETPPTDPDAPGAFRFGETGKLARIFSEAGAVGVKERNFNFRIEAPISRDQFWEMRAGTSGTLREKLANLGTEKVQQIASEMKEAIREFFPNDQMSFPAQMIIVTGRKS